MRGRCLIFGIFIVYRWKGAETAIADGAQTDVAAGVDPRLTFRQEESTFVSETPRKSLRLVHRGWSNGHETSSNELSEERSPLRVGLLREKMAAELMRATTSEWLEAKLTPELTMKRLRLEASQYCADTPAFMKWLHFIVLYENIMEIDYSSKVLDIFKEKGITLKVKGSVDITVAEQYFKEYQKLEALLESMLQNPTLKPLGARMVYRLFNEHRKEYELLNTTELKLKAQPVAVLCDHGNKKMRFKHLVHWLTYSDVFRSKHGLDSYSYEKAARDLITVLSSLPSKRQFLLYRLLKNMPGTEELVKEATAQKKYMLKRLGRRNW